MGQWYFDQRSSLIQLLQVKSAIWLYLVLCDILLFGSLIPALTFLFFELVAAAFKRRDNSSYFPSFPSALLRFRDPRIGESDLFSWGSGIMTLVYIVCLYHDFVFDVVY